MLVCVGGSGVVGRGAMGRLAGGTIRSLPYCLVNGTSCLFFMIEVGCCDGGFAFFLIAVCCGFALVIQALVVAFLRLLAVLVVVVVSCAFFFFSVC